MMQVKKYKVKICGMKFPDNIREVSALGPDYLGFIFHIRSPRCCRDEGKDIINHIEKNSIPVMVSVNMPENELLEIVSDWGFRVVQLHGDETPQFCGRLREHGLEVWKAISVGSSLPQSGKSWLDKTKLYEGMVDMFLFDTDTKSHGGSGKRFDWNVLEEYKGEIPFILSGGISNGNETEILSLAHPNMIGVDLNSRFEISPGLKNSNLISSFISNLNVLKN